jgi:hypothetical protein
MESSRRLRPVEYLFRTAKPGLYPGRTRHVHTAINVFGRSKLTTQLYVQGEPQNNSDGVLNGIRDAAARGSVVVPWTAIESSRIGELAARFDIVMGLTPETRGSCTFETKLNNAQRAGAVAALIFSTHGSPDAISMALGSATLPAEMVTYSDGIAIKQTIA